MSRVWPDPWQWGFLASPCERCGAASGYWCTTNDGRPVAHMHADRPRALLTTHERYVLEVDYRSRNRDGRWVRPGTGIQSVKAVEDGRE